MSEILVKVKGRFCGRNERDSGNGMREKTEKEISEIFLEDD